MVKEQRWGWVVVFGGFMIYFVIDGIRYSFGLLYVEFLTKFQQSKGDTAWIGSLMVGVLNITGPMVGMLINLFGCRSIAICGSVISASGFILTAFCSELFQLYITFGILAGIGFGMTAGATSVIVVKYFNKKRPIAVGITVCGSGIGGFALNPLARYLIDEYGWRGTVLIEAGLILNCVIFSSTFRPMPRGNSSDRYGHRNDKKESSHSEETITENLRPKRDETEYHANLKSCRTFQSYSLARPGSVDDVQLKETLLEKSTRDKPNKEEDIVNDNVTTTRTLRRLSVINSCAHWCGKMYKFSLLKDAYCLIVLLSGFFVSLAFDIPYTYIPHFALQNGHSNSDIMWLMSSIGISSTVSRCLIGFVASRPWVNNLLLFYSSLLIGAGLVTALCPLCTTYFPQLVIAVLFGVFTGGYVCLTTVVLSDLFSADFIADSYGLYVFASGIGNLCGTPLAGWLYDSTGRYDIPFLVAGLEFGIGGLLLLIKPCKEKIIQRQDKNNINATENELVIVLTNLK